MDAKLMGTEQSDYLGLICFIELSNRKFQAHAFAFVETLDASERI